MIVLENRSRTQKTFNLTHRIAPLRRVHKRARRDAEGNTHVHDHRVVYPDSITILAGRTSQPVPDNYAGAPEIAKAIKRGDVVVRPAPEQVVDAATKADVAESADVADLAEDSAPTIGRRRPRG